jgi:hypothetical protein
VRYTSVGATASNAKYGKPREGTGKRYSDGFLGFVDIPLNDAAKAELDGFSKGNVVEVLGFVVALADEGYKFSLVCDVEHSSYIATCTGKNVSNGNKGYALSARGPSAHQAMLALWYKVEVICKWGDWVRSGAVADGQLPIWG